MNKKIVIDEELIKRLEIHVAGEPVNYRFFHRFSIGALPNTIGTLMRNKEIEAYAQAISGEFTRNQKILILVGGIAGIGFLVFFMLAYRMGWFSF